MLPNVIIAGVPKAGTTSLFRYLSSHPEVCASSIKEIKYFLGDFDDSDDESIKKYKSYFSHCNQNETVRLEASPAYLLKSKKTAKRMHCLLPDAKLIFVLREPISTLQSFIKFKEGISSDGLQPEMFVSLAKRIMKDPEVGTYERKKSHIARRLYAGCYNENIEEFMTFYKKEQIGVFFFEEMANDIQYFTKKVCRFIGIGEYFYDDYRFSIENKTRNYRSPYLHRIVFRINMKLEPILNKYPQIRNSIRSVYHLIAEKPGPKQIMKNSDIEILKRFYEPTNTKLKKLLNTHYPEIKLPEWLL